jgi:Flp pilus assembly protein TadG
MREIRYGPVPKGAADGASSEEPRGQAIVLVMFAMLALIAITGLAIDGGRLYQGRRQVQNAADAAALAGTRLLASERCSPSSGLDAVVWTEVLAYAQHNEVSNDHASGSVAAWYVNKDETRLGEVGVIGTVPNGTTGVEVSTMITEPTTFMRITGQDHMAAAAASMAMFGPVERLGGGVLPIGVPLSVVRNLGEGAEFTMKDDDGAFCRDPDMIDTCVGYDGEGGIEGNSQRGWLNLSYIYNRDYWDSFKPPNRVFGSSSANNLCRYNGDGSVDVAGTGLRGWASNDCPYPHWIEAGAEGMLNGDYITGLGGSRPNAIGEIAEAYDTDDIVYAPVFDYIYSRSDMDRDDTFADLEPDIGWIGGNYYYYHIVGFVGVKLQTVSKNDKIITGSFQDLIIGEGEMVPSDGIGNIGCSQPGLLAVKLWR